MLSRSFEAHDPTTHRERERATKISVTLPPCCADNQKQAHAASGASTGKKTQFSHTHKRPKPLLPHEIDAVLQLDAREALPRPAAGSKAQGIYVRKQRKPLTPREVDALLEMDAHRRHGKPAAGKPRFTAQQKQHPRQQQAGAGTGRERSTSQLEPPLRRAGKALSPITNAQRSQGKHRRSSGEAQQHSCTSEALAKEQQAVASQSLCKEDPPPAPAETANRCDDGLRLLAVIGGFVLRCSL